MQLSLEHVGKTSLMRVMAGLDTASVGRVLADGVALIGTHYRDGK